MDQPNGDTNVEAKSRSKEHVFTLSVIEDMWLKRVWICRNHHGRITNKAIRKLVLEMVNRLKNDQVISPFVECYMDLPKIVGDLKTNGVYWKTVEKYYVVKFAIDGAKCFACSKDCEPKMI